MDRGSVYRRCGCRDKATGRLLGAGCPGLRSWEHGSWYFSGDPPQLVEAAGIPGDLRLPEDHDQDRRAEDAAELAAADRTGFALLVDETGVGERAAVTNVEPNMAGFDPIDDVRELNRVASDAEEDHGRVALGELAAGRGG
jgi:hypothetical protein